MIPPSTHILAGEGGGLGGLRAAGCPAGGTCALRPSPVLRLQLAARRGTFPQRAASAAAGDPVAAGIKRRREPQRPPQGMRRHRHLPAR